MLTNIHIHYEQLHHVNLKTYTNSDWTLLINNDHHHEHIYHHRDKIRLLLNRTYQHSGRMHNMINQKIINRSIYRTQVHVNSSLALYVNGIIIVQLIVITRSRMGVLNVDIPIIGFVIVRRFSTSWNP
jgi:hypothetical protein